MILKINRKIQKSYPKKLRLLYFYTMNTILILNAQVVNEGKIETKDVFIKDGQIDKISSHLSGLQANTVINAQGKRSEERRVGKEC